MLDAIGFGIEAFDRVGKSRAYDEKLPQCPIRDEGVLHGAPFRGVTGLADAVLASGRLDVCLVTHLYEFAMGRPDKPEDQGFILKLTDAFKAKNRTLGELLLAFVSEPAFAERREVN
jgi:hypothetical protein